MKKYLQKPNHNYLIKFLRKYSLISFLTIICFIALMTQLIFTIPFLFSSTSTSSTSNVKDPRKTTDKKNNKRSRKESEGGGNNNKKNNYYHQKYHYRRLQLERQRNEYNMKQQIDEPDGYFNNIPIYQRTKLIKDMKSYIHCVGNTYEDMFYDTSLYENKYKRRKLNISNDVPYDVNSQGWQQRSCHFTGLFCFNMSSNDYVIYQSYHDSILQNKLLNIRPYLDASSSILLSINTSNEYIYDHEHRNDDEKDSNDENNNVNTPDMEHDGTKSSPNGLRKLIQPLYVGLGSINLKWNIVDRARLKWFPKIIDYKEESNNDNDDTTISYNELPEWMIMIPYHSLNGANPGHLIWDDYLPIYTLLHMFQLLDTTTSSTSSNNKNNDDDNEDYNDKKQNNYYDILPMRYVLPQKFEDQRGLWASCDLRKEKNELCTFMMKKFGPLLLGENYPYNYTSTQTYQFELNHNKKSTKTNEKQNDNQKNSDLICSKHGLAGISALSDHGTIKSHGWEEEDYKIMHNYGRGGLLYDFRNYMIQNLQYSNNKIQNIQSVTQLKKPYKIVFSQKSSDIYIRNLEFINEIQLLKQYFPPELVNVVNYTMKDLTLNEQIEVVSTAAIYITLCGGGAVTGMFLPKGSTIFIYYSEDGGVDNNHMSGKPALLDYDLFNSLSHLHVIWLPRNTMKTKHDQITLSALVQHQLELIDQQQQQQQES